MMKQYLRGITLALILVFSGAPSWAAPYAALVMDARSGEVLHARSADRRLAPASLTKMMTLYLAFVELESGRMRPEQMIRISANAAAEPRSKLYVRSGSRIQFRYLIRAAAIMSANDAATAIGEAISGSEAEFARYMTQTARAMGMKNTQFKNANGLTQRGHYSTARDMALLGRRLFYDFLTYYGLFSRITDDAGISRVVHTNRRFLRAYEGADGIKTGYTDAAGFNLVASADHNGERIIAVMFGGTSTAQRNGRVAELMDMGFERINSDRAFLALPRLTLNPANGATMMASNASGSGVVSRANRPLRRAESVAVMMARNIDDILQEEAIEAAIAAAETGPMISPGPKFVQVPGLNPETVTRPVRRPALGSSMALAAVEPLPEIIPQIRATNPNAQGDYAVQIGAFRNRGQAERILLQTALLEVESFASAERSITQAQVQGVSMYQARFVGMSAATAAKACDRLLAQQSDCAIIGPAG